MQRDANQPAEKPVRIGEVVEAETHRFTVQCYRLYDAPPLGAIVNTSYPSIYAVVSGVSTEALDPGRPVIARGENEETQEDVYSHNPQLSRLLCTRFQGVIVGYAEGETLLQGLSPRPPPIHAFVYPSSPEELERLTRSLDFLYLLANSGIPTSDEVIAACLRLASQQVAEGQQLLVRAGKALAVELTGQLPRLNAILRRLA